MTFAADAWPLLPRSTPISARPASVWRIEMAKLVRQWRVRLVAGVCWLAPLAAAAFLLSAQTTPSDTLFGQWIHTSGLAFTMAMLSWAGQWGLPAVAAVVAGDIFSSEDHHGTWRTVLTRSRSRNELFVGKVLAAVTFSVACVALLTAASFLAALAGGLRPVVGLGGQEVASSHAATLALVSWATQLPPVLAFTGFAMLASVASRHSAVGIGVPILLGLALQVVGLVPLPPLARDLLPSTPFGTWVGLWTVPSFPAPVVVGVGVSLAWTALAVGGAWLVFRRRDLGGV
jgi:ABC-2 type transport system permease protein